MACTSIIEGEGAPEPQGFHVAVGAEVTLTFGAPGCGTERDPTSACLTAGIKSVSPPALASSGAFTIVSSSVEPNNSVRVTLRANVIGTDVLSVPHAGAPDGSTKDEFILRSRAITHVVEKVGCQWSDPPPPSRRYAVTTGSAFSVALTAMAETKPLLSGALELVTSRGGLEPLDPPKGTATRRVQAPSTPGSVVWTLAGATSTPLTFDFYDAAAVGVDVGSTSKETITVRPALNGAPACIYQGNGRALVRVAEGACKLLLGDYEVEGDLPVTLKNGGATFAVAGTGSCTIEGRSKGGGADRVTFAADATAREERGSGDPIGTTPRDVGGALPKRDTCSRSGKISNGKCEAITLPVPPFVLPDGDCFSDIDWKVDHLDGSSSTPGTGDEGKLKAGAPVGVGLLTELRVNLELQVITVGVTKLIPNNLKFGTSALEVQSLGCDRSSYEALSVRAPAAGSHKLHLTAENALEPFDYTVQARPVARVAYLGEPTDAHPSGDVLTSRYFVGSKVPIELRHTDSGGAPLAGVAPYRVSGTIEPSGDGSATARPGSVFTGRVPNKITLASAAAPSSHVIEVVDIAAATEVVGLLPQEVKKVGDEVCVEPLVLGNGQVIHGTPPARPRVSFAGGEACAAKGGEAPWAPLIATGRRLCLVADPSAPRTDVRIALGSAGSPWACQSSP